MTRTKIGIIGCGNISGAYFKAAKMFNNIEVVACADLDVERARAQSAEFAIPKACAPDQLIGDPDVSIVVNLTIPKAHYSVSLAALQAGKHVYVEKPLAITRQEGQELIRVAGHKRLRVGCAPDTFLGGAHQTCRKLIADGVIGEPIAATAFMMGHGAESWHPDPEFLYKVGGGPMFDMGPYYLTALVNMIGPAVRVAGATRITFPERIISSEPRKGAVMRVDVPTHIAGLIDFENGAIGTIITSFDVWDHTLPCIQVYGTEGSMQVPDPNYFGGIVRVKGAADTDWRDIPLTHGNIENARGIGVADMASAIRNNRPHRANGNLAAHVLDIMHGFHESSSTGMHYKIAVKCDRPAAFPLGLRSGEVD